MALVTYTLLAAFASGSIEILGISLSKSFAVVIFEFLCIRSVYFSAERYHISGKLM